MSRRSSYIPRMIVLRWGMEFKGDRKGGNWGLWEVNDVGC